MIKLKIIATTDHRYVGETLNIYSPFEENETIVYKNTQYTIVSMSQNDNFITLYCPNYITTLKIIGSSN